MLELKAEKEGEASEFYDVDPFNAKVLTLLAQIEKNTRKV